MAFWQKIFVFVFTGFQISSQELRNMISERQNKGSNQIRRARYRNFPITVFKKASRYDW